MASTAGDINDLEKKLNDGESDKVLNTLAIEIYQRVRHEVLQAKRKKDHIALAFLKQQVEDFGEILASIENRRHAHVLDEFKEYTYRNP